MLDGRTDPAMALIFAQGDAGGRSARDGAETHALSGGAGIWAGLAALFAVFSPGSDAVVAEPVPVPLAAPGGLQG